MAGGGPFGAFTYVLVRPAGLTATLGLLSLASPPDAAGLAAGLMAGRCRWPDVRADRDVRARQRAARVDEIRRTRPPRWSWRSPG